MGTRAFALSLALLIVAGAVSAQEHSSEGRGWTRFTSEPGRFSVLVPSPPTEKVETQQSPHGPYTTHLFSVSSDDTLFVVAWVDYDPGFNFGVQAELNANRDNFVKNSGLKLTGTTKQITLDGNPGIEFTAEGGNALVKSRVYIVGRRPYMLIALSRTGDLSDGDRFLTSLEVSR